MLKICILFMSLISLSCGEIMTPTVEKLNLYESNTNNNSHRKDDPKNGFSPLAPLYPFDEFQNHPDDYWGFSNSNAPYIWPYNEGDCTNLKIGVIDTGVDYNHIDLAQSIYYNTNETQGNGVDDDKNGYVDDIRGWNFVSENNNPMDDHGHGTHVAGVIGAKKTTLSIFTGICWKAKIVPLKALGQSGTGTISDITEAIEYANKNNIKITNNSYGGKLDICPDQNSWFDVDLNGNGIIESTEEGCITKMMGVLNSTMKDVRDSGDIFIVAAGNEGSDNDTNFAFPANFSLAYENVISVAAIDQNSEITNFSNFGKKSVTLAAPGKQILSTKLGGTYIALNGTSMATPFVTGGAALLWNLAPTNTNMEIINIIRLSAKSLNSTSSKQTKTNGKLDLEKAVQLLYE